VDLSIILLSLCCKDLKKEENFTFKNKLKQYKKVSTFRIFTSPLYNLFVHARDAQLIQPPQTTLTSVSVGCAWVINLLEAFVE